MKIQFRFDGHNVATALIMLDGNAIHDAGVRHQLDTARDEHIVTLELPGIRAVDAEPLGIDLAVAEVLRQYVADVAMRDVLATALIDKLTGETADEPAIDELTFRDLEALAVDKASDYRNRCDQSEPNQRRAAREFSLAVTALEDAGIRFTRGLAELKGVRSDVDLEKLSARTERERFEAEVANATLAESIDTEPGGEAGDDTGAGGA